MQVLDLVDGVEGGRQAAVYAQYGIVDHGRKTQAVEDVDARLSGRGVAGGSEDETSWNERMRHHGTRGRKGGEESKAQAPL
jgi:hypothetical protein